MHISVRTSFIDWCYLFYIETLNVVLKHGQDKSVIYIANNMQQDAYSTTGRMPDILFWFPFVAVGLCAYACPCVCLYVFVRLCFLITGNYIQEQSRYQHDLR